MAQTAKPIIGIRPGEKIHEEMITASDSFTTVDLGKYYAILPSDGWVEAKYREAGRPINPVKEGFAYNSGTNPDFPDGSAIARAYQRTC